MKTEAIEKQIGILRAWAKQEQNQAIKESYIQMADSIKAELAALKEENEKLQWAAIGAINTHRLCEEMPFTAPNDEHIRVQREHRQAITRLNTAFGHHD